MQEDEFKQRSMNTVYIVASGYTLDSIVQVYCIHGLMHTLALHLFTMATATLLGLSPWLLQVTKVTGRVLYRYYDVCKHTHAHCMINHNQKINSLCK